MVFAVVYGWDVTNISIDFGWQLWSFWRETVPKETITLSSFFSGVAVICRERSIGSYHDLNQCIGAVDVVILKIDVVWSRCVNGLTCSYLFYLQGHVFLGVVCLHFGVFWIYILKFWLIPKISSKTYSLFLKSRNLNSWKSINTRLRCRNQWFLSSIIAHLHVQCLEQYRSINKMEQKHINILTKNADRASTVGFRHADVQGYEKNSNIVTISRLHADKNISTMNW